MKRGAALIGVVVALGMSASACGSGGGTPAVSIKTLQAAVSNTQDVASERFTMTISVEAAGEHVDIDADGVASGDGKTLQLTMTLPTLGSIEARLVDNVMYMDFGDLGALGGKLPEGKRWVSIDLDALQSQAGGGVGSLIDQTRNSGPTQGLEYLQGLSGDVTKVGDDTVAGEHATHYRASIDYAKVAAELPNTSADVAEKLAKLGTVPADVWIDDQDRVVKMHFSIDGSALGTGAGSTDLTMVITDFGVPVDVQAPPADETVDLASLGAVPA
jgi:hypothetical protein